MACTATRELCRANNRIRLLCWKKEKGRVVFLKRSRLAAVAQKDLGKERVKSIVFREIARETFLGNFLSLFVCISYML